VLKKGGQAERLKAGKVFKNKVWLFEKTLLPLHSVSGESS
jgi:hypothetical protein